MLKLNHLTSVNLFSGNNLKTKKMEMLAVLVTVSNLEATQMSPNVQQDNKG